MGLFWNEGNKTKHYLSCETVVNSYLFDEGINSSFDYLHDIDIIEFKLAETN